VSTVAALPARPAGALLTRGPLVPVALAWLAVLAVLWSTFADMWRAWGASGTFTHGYVIFPIAFYLLWLRRERWLDLQLRPSLAGGMLVLGAIAVWLVGALLHLNVVMQFAAVALLVSAVLAIAGYEALRAGAFALLFMFFAVPAGEELVPWLMDFTARFTVAALDAVGVPVYAEGRLIHIPTGNFSVEKACSGIRYLIASVVLGTLFAHIYYRATWRRALFVALCVLVPILANGLRAFMIVILAHLSDNEIAVGIDHLIYGWFFFGVVMLIVFWIGRQFAEPPEAAVVPAAASTAAASAATAPATPNLAPSTLAPWLALLALLVPLVVGRVAAATLQSGASETVGPNEAPRVPAPMAGWTGPITLSADWAPGFVAPTRTVTASYLQGLQSAVDVAVVSYAHERPGAELVNSENRLFDEERWNWIGERAISLPLGDGREVPVLAVNVRQGLSHRAIWRVYVVGGEPVSGGMQAKLARARALFAEGGATGVALVVSSAQNGPDATPERAVREFLVNYYAPLLACLRDDAPLHDGRQPAPCVPAP